jgi:hypothetical protein
VILNVIRPVCDEGTVIVFEGAREDGGLVRFAVDHRPAQTIVDGLLEGSIVDVEVEPFQVLRSA